MPLKRLLPLSFPTNVFYALLISHLIFLASPVTLYFVVLLFARFSL